MQKKAAKDEKETLLAPVDRAERQLTKILMATLEYEIPDWSIKVRIGGLGVISSLMGKYMDNPIVWVVPKVGDVEYPESEKLEPIIVGIAGKEYQIDVSCHNYRNVKYVLLDAGIFRTRTRKDPYTAKMDDLESAIFYSGWNQAIAEVLRREKVDVYHINDFHCGIAQLYLLPELVPCVVSCHNAEFQGLWPLRSSREVQNVCGVFNLPLDVCQRYVQYGSTFNLLFAASMYLSYHQKGIGAGGVSDKYGDRCYLRYPTMWNLSKMASIQNPNPSDTEGLEEHVAPTVEEGLTREQRMEYKASTQKWAGLDVDESKRLFVFVGRWSRQKGIDLIADLTPRILEHYPNAQVICIGPVIDLYGTIII